MTDKQIELVESSWDYIILNTKQAGLLFYETLFKLDPSLRQLFREDISVQSQKLVSMITFVVAKLENLDQILPDVQALGARHGKYKVHPEHYETVGKALISTLKTGMGDEWTAEHEQAWLQAYNILSKAMTDAMQKSAVTA